MRDRESEFFGLLASEGDNLSDLRCGELGAAAGAVFVPQHVDDEGLQLAVADWLKFCGVDLVGRLRETCSPTAHSLLLDAHRLGLLKADIVVDGDEDDLRPRDEAILDGGRAHQPLKYQALARKKTDGGGVSRHPPGMIHIGGKGNHRQSCPEALVQRR